MLQSKLNHTTIMPYFVSVPTITLLSHLLLWQLLGDGGLIHRLSLLHQPLLDVGDAFSLDVARTHQHTLEGSQPKVIVRLGGQLLVTQPSTHDTHCQHPVSSLLSAVSSQQSTVCSLLSTVCCQQSHVSSLLTAVSCQQSLLSSLQSAVCCLQSHVSSLLPAVYCHQLPVSNLLSALYCLRLFSALHHQYCQQYLSGLYCQNSFISILSSLHHEHSSVNNSLSAFQSQHSLVSMTHCQQYNYSSAL